MQCKKKGFTANEETCQCDGSKSKYKPKCPASYEKRTDGKCGCKLAVDVCDYEVKCVIG